MTSATSLTSKEQQAYDIVTLITKILDDNYEGKYKNKLEDITEIANEDEIVLKFELLLGEMNKLFMWVTVYYIIINLLSKYIWNL